MNKLKESRSLSFLIVLAVYVIAFFVGLLVYRGLADTSWHYLWKFFLADVVATIVVWLFGLLFRNVSMYDPYWSVAPPVMLTVWAAMTGNWTGATILLLIGVWYWGVRLTGNWAFTFRNLNAEDWRYTMYRTEQSPFMFFLTNLFGLNMMPTVLVFLMMIPGFFLIEAGVPATPLVWFGFLGCVAAATIQLISDTQRHRFAKAHKGEVCNVGLWKHGRHPNYFGELLMWCSVFIMYLPVCGQHSPDIWFIGALLNIILFCFASVPMMEKRQLQNKPGYAEYRANTRMFI